MLHQEMHVQGVLSQDVHMGDAQDMQTQEVLSQGIDPHLLSRETKHELDPQNLVLLSTGDGLSDFEVYISEITNSQHMKSELDQYLEESLLPREKEFDLLGWWKLNKMKYPTLSKMAADILSIPVSTVLPDSVFDTENKKIDNYQSSLRPVTLEALVCAKDWLQYGSSSPSSLSSLENPKAVVKMEY
uniref:Zinc finger BED domain-containing protein RICESLEEPER 1-like n=1 Tax=Rhizophora mucronata TaxID=61149 RepID=A0A2P2Q6U9_RHIMU